ncbi:fasciclin domain-containing protein [Streptomyces sp. NPDC005485]|uniref:fasciclin domain-containing protein n=1 Tax=Streptomyces sp. NPDC005485 TaxID=3155591 RepID=UPI0033B4E392
MPWQPPPGLSQDLVVTRPRRPTSVTLLALATAALLAPTACSDGGARTPRRPTRCRPPTVVRQSDRMTTDEPFGPACSSAPKGSTGSFAGMPKNPVATAASNNPALSTPVTAVKKAGLVDTLNNAQNITVLAPANDAFAKCAWAASARLTSAPTTPYAHHRFVTRPRAAAA